MCVALIALCPAALAALSVTSDSEVRPVITQQEGTYDISVPEGGNIVVTGPLEIRNFTLCEGGSVTFKPGAYIRTSGICDLQRYTTIKLDYGCDVSELLNNSLLLFYAPNRVSEDCVRLETADGRWYFKYFVAIGMGGFHYYNPISYWPVNGTGN